MPALVESLDRFRRRLRRVPVVEAAITVLVVVLSIALIAIVVARLVRASDAGAKSRSANAPKVRTEVPLGEFDYVMPVMSGNRAPNPTALRLMEFSAAAVIQGTGREIGNLEGLVKSCEFRIRALVDRTARTATRDELAEPELTVVRERIRGKINTLLGEPVVADVIFSNFRAFDVVDEE